MTRRSILACTIVGAIVLLAFQALSHAAVPWQELTMKQYSDSTTSATPAPASESGVYFNAYGVFIATAMSADVSDKTAMMGPMMIRQLGLNLGVVFLLCLLVGRLSSNQPLAAATASALAGLAAAAALALYQANWYGFTAQYTIVNAIDTSLGLFVTGFVIGGLSLHLERNADVRASSSVDYASRPTMLPVG